MRQAMLPVSALLIFAMVPASKAVEPCARMSYDNRNQIDYGPLKLRSLQGKAVDPDGVPVPGVCVGLFTESDHRLIVATATLANGEFQMKDAPTGYYRLVAECPPFGAANARVRLGRGAASVVLKMRPVGVDTTSYVALGH